MSTLQRTPGRRWTVRITGRADRQAKLSCSSTCDLPERSRDLHHLAQAAVNHLALHANQERAPQPARYCACQCSAQHPDAKTGSCAGAVVLVLVCSLPGRVWHLAETCASCARLIPGACIVRTAARPPRAARAPATAAPAHRPVPGGFAEA
ncbi:hypothetical protein PUR49_08045 [Streptomyces sp. BE147]|uniref:hypothetical protein n=1 Tax=Streptomyces sp. BE147 TaxID=3002524 RepID=UPI002E77188A|nr:hypothetical protein [Streptomyces sp. BE147]MEE1736450.1 hypothetical protein [Streptomyces sp. BE147]